MKGRKSLFGTLVIPLLVIFWCVQCHSQTETGKWYKGDLHSHSNYSGGDSSVADVLARAESLGLDFFALTDHDTSMQGDPTHWFDPGFRSDEMLLLYGVEWTSDVGHGNVWASTPFSYDKLWEANLANDAQAAVEAAHDEGAIFSIDHPTAFLDWSWKYPVYDDIDAIEVWNSMYRFPNYSRLAVHHFWDDLLLSGRRIPAVGGSDTHHLVEWQSRLFGHGNPTTWVYAEEYSPDGILAGLKAGHTTISYAPSALRLDFTADGDNDGSYDILTGDTLDCPPGQVIAFKLKLVCPDGNGVEAESVSFEPIELSPSDRAGNQGNQDVDLPFSLIGNGTTCNGLYGLTIFKNGSTFKTFLVSGFREIIFKDLVTTSLPAYYRAELYGMPEVNPLYTVLYGIEIAITNPIYLNY